MVKRFYQDAHKTKGTGILASAIASILASTRSTGILTGSVPNPRKNARHHHAKTP